MYGEHIFPSFFERDYYSFKCSIWLLYYKFLLLLFSLFLLAKRLYIFIMGLHRYIYRHTHKVTMGHLRGWRGRKRDKEKCIWMNVSWLHCMLCSSLNSPFITNLIMKHKNIFLSSSCEDSNGNIYSFFSNNFRVTSRQKLRESLLNN